MKSLRILLAALALLSATSFAATSWGDDYKKALAQARSEKRFVLLEFGGSDWCVRCKKMDRDVFSQDAFKDFAKAKLVLIDVDFPIAKRQSQTVQDQNEALLKQYGIKVYPTFVLLNSSGEKIGQLGFEEDGVAEFLRELDKLMGKK